MTVPRRHDAVTAFLARRFSRARLRHTLGTVTVARELAGRYGIPPEKAELAALLHDAGKALKPAAMAAYVRRHALAVPFREAIIRHHPSLLHSVISAHIARAKFGVRDPQVLRAIVSHTVGGPTMDTLAKIIYIADAISPERRYRGAQHIRRLSRRHLDAALRAAVAMKVAHVIENEEWIHPFTIDLWNSLLKK